MHSRLSSHPPIRTRWVEAGDRDEEVAQNRNAAPETYYMGTINACANDSHRERVLTEQSQINSASPCFAGLNP